jgi:hypothetical protein
MLSSHDLLVDFKGVCYLADFCGNFVWSCILIFMSSYALGIYILVLAESSRAF